MEEKETFISTEPVITKPLNLDLIQDATKLIDKSYRDWIGSFEGIQCVVDPSLKGISYYICVSKEIHAELLKISEENANAPTRNETNKD